MIINPFTRQVLNANPEGCNQYSGKDCWRSGDTKDVVMPHFGTLQAARKFERVNKPARKYQVEIKNPAIIEDTAESYRDRPITLARAIIASKVKGISESSMLRDAQKAKTKEDQLRAIREHLLKAGYDGLEYENWVEHRGSKSLVPLHEHQIKSLGLISVPKTYEEEEEAFQSWAQRNRDEIQPYIPLEAYKERYRSPVYEPKHF